MIQSIFEINDADGALVVTVAPMIEIAEFNAVFNKGAIGIMEMKYVWARKDIRSPYCTMTEHEGHTRCRRFAKLEDDWVADEYVKEAMAAYDRESYDLNPELKLLQSLKMGLSMTSNIVTKLNQTMEKKLYELDMAMAGSNQPVGLPPVDPEKMMQELVGHVTTLMTITGKLESTLTTIGNLEKKVAAMFESEGIRGSIEKGDFEDPEDVGVKV